MGFGDLKTKSGQEALNKFLADHSYIEGYQILIIQTVFNSVQNNHDKSHNRLSPQ